MSNQNLNFDDGYMSFTLNNDPNRVIRFNPTDFGIITRIKEAYNAIDKAADSAGDIKINPDGSTAEQIEGAAEALALYDNAVKGAIDSIFNSEISDIAFGKQSPLSLVGGGKFLWESFLECICKVVEKEANTKIEISRKKLSKYKGQVYRK